jgi:nucleotide-binding universal stress UspA family protein
VPSASFPIAIGDDVSAAASPTLLLCYDGSDRAAHAIAVAGRLFPGATAKVVHVWEPVEHIVARYAALAPYLGEQITEADADAARESSLVAEEGAKHAEDAGLAASAHNVTLATTVWEAVIDASRELGADVIVTGTRSLHGVKEMLAGTLSHALVQHSAVPVLAIPSPAQD